MKIVTETPALLVVAHRPRFLPGLLALFTAVTAVQTFRSWDQLTTVEIVGSMLAVLGCFLAAGLTAQGSAFVFDGSSRRLFWVRRRMLSRVKGQATFGAIIGVGIEAEYDDGKSTRLVLQTTSGKVPMASHFSSMEPHEEMAERIREWLAKQEAGMVSDIPA